MIEEQGRVVAVECGCVWIETARTCGGCVNGNARGGCAQYLTDKYGVGASLFCVKAVGSLVLKKGDRVVVGVQEGSLLKASFLIYFFPILLMMLGVWLLSMLVVADWALILVACGLLLSGFGIVRTVDKKSADLCRVEVVRKLPSKGLYFSEFTSE